MRLYCPLPPALNARIVRTHSSNFSSAFVHSNGQLCQIKGCCGNFIHSFIYGGTDWGQAPRGDIEEAENSRLVLASLQPPRALGAMDTGTPDPARECGEEGCRHTLLKRASAPDHLEQGESRQAEGGWVQQAVGTASAEARRGSRACAPRGFGSSDCSGPTGRGQPAGLSSCSSP